MQIIHQRAEVEPFLRQRIYFAQITEIYKDSFINHISGIPSESNIIYKEFFKQKRKKGFEFELPPQATIYHPFEPIQIQKLRVEKIFRSNSRPLLLKLYPKGYLDVNSDLLIFKSGDDLRRDMAVMSMFKLMNLL